MWCAQTGESGKQISSEQLSYKEGLTARLVEQTKPLEPWLCSPQQKEAWQICTLAVLSCDPSSTSSRRVWLHTKMRVPLSVISGPAPSPPHCNAELGKFDEGSAEIMALFLSLASSAHWAEHPYVTPLGTTRSYQWQLQLPLAQSSLQLLHSYILGTLTLATCLFPYLPFPFPLKQHLFSMVSFVSTSTSVIFKEVKPAQGSSIRAGLTYSGTSPATHRIQQWATEGLPESEATDMLEFNSIRGTFFHKYK